MDKKLNHIKNVLHGFFLSIGMTIAEPHTILPLIVSHFGGGAILIGLYSALLKGGVVIIQLYAAFHAQSYPYMLKYLRRVFLVRFFAWFFIGFSIIIFGDEYKEITLFCIGIGLFIFSFSAGFGTIYFKEITAKIFTHTFRGKTMAIRQFFSAFGALLSGTGAGIVLSSFEAPLSYGILFIISTFLMGFGYLAFGLVDEPKKENVAKKEKSFGLFLQNAFAILRVDKVLQNQIFTFFFAYSYLFALPFIILDAKGQIDLDGTAIGLLITAQTVGAMFSNIIWGKLTRKGLYKRTSNITIAMFIFAISLAFIGGSIWIYMSIFFIVGAAIDGNRLASENLIIMIAPEEKRPIYMALQNNIVSIGIFFSILGGVILSFSNYTILYSFSLLMLCFSFVASLKLKD
ncbi:MAG: MFS transporter [Arcobacteraceae bacterium]|jgi:MFS family permease|nr:MFS transporter [Arcobacteraceae bacterium]